MSCGAVTAPGKAGAPTSVASPRHDYAPSKTPRYYQLNAINRTVQAIAAGQNRVLLVMATGTGKTYTAFQIIWRLWKSRRQEAHPVPGRPQHPDRPDHGQRLPPVQGRDGQAQPQCQRCGAHQRTGPGGVEELDLAVHKTTKKVDTSYEIYLSLYQAVTGTEKSATSTSSSAPTSST
jgi:type I restriction enzyme R subunit